MTARASYGQDRCVHGVFVGHNCDDCEQLAGLLERVRQRDQIVHAAATDFPRPTIIPGPPGRHPDLHFQLPTIHLTRPQEHHRG